MRTRLPSSVTSMRTTDPLGRGRHAEGLPLAAVTATALVTVIGFQVPPSRRLKLPAAYTTPLWTARARTNERVPSAR